jgi:abequosyltransferase
MQRVSGIINQSSIILTIAIPTWNRCEYILNSLSILLPEISKYNDCIELIISDNASNDNTYDKVKTLLSRYTSVKYKLFKNDYNLGFFGNFKNCMIEATGKYFWLLSDDDYIERDLIDKIIKILRLKNIGAIFINDLENLKNNNKIFSFHNKEQFLTKNIHKHSLISSIVHVNNINDNKYIFDCLENNALIGFAMYMYCIKDYDLFAEIHGNNLHSRKDGSVRFNGLNIFTYDLNYCLVQLKNIYNYNIINTIANSFLKSNIKLYFKIYKFYKKKSSNKYKIIDLFFLYYKYINFWLHIFPLIIINRKVFTIQRGIRNQPKYFELNNYEI